jgi:surface antigen
VTPQATPRRSRSRTRRSQQLTTATTYAAILALIASIVSVGYQSPVEQQVAASRSTSTAQAIKASSPSVDQIVAADLAASAAENANLAVASNVTELSTSLNAKSELAQSEDNLVSKPQIIQANAAQRGITSYRTVAGDTVPSVAGRFGVSVETVKWANNLTSDNLVAGSDLSIPGTNGVVYTVRAGDTPASLAQKYQTAESRIISYNDLELTGLNAGQRIVIPGGILPAAERPTIRVATPSYSNSYTSPSAAVVGNRYSYGYCTWYAYNRRAQIGRPVGSFWGNASTWASYARSSGYLVNRTPAIGAVMQDSYSAGGYGHVAVVESINGDGSIVVSEMNYAGWNVTSTRTVTNPGSYNYIH